MIRETRESTSHLHNMIKLKSSTNYKTWAIKTQMILIWKRLWNAIKPDNDFLTTKAKDNRIVNSSTITAIVDKSLNQQAVATIILSLDNSFINYAIGIFLAKVLWKTLKNLFSLQGFTACHLSHKELVTTILANSKLVENFIDSFKQCKCRLCKTGSPVPN